MRTFVLSACLLLLISSSALGESLTMNVHLRTGGTTTLSTDGVRSIQFADLTAGVSPSNGGVLSGGIQLLRSYPNPFRPSTTIEYQIGTQANVRIRVFDLKGALVRELQNESVSAGRHQVTWDGTDRNRTRVSSGVYFVRVECGAQARSGHLVLVN
jgi:hypothetical protein